MSIIFGPSAGLPSGAVVAFAGAAAPAGWLFCSGQAVSRTTYAALFAALGTAFGVGDGSTTFNLPDLRGRTAFGKDDMGGVAANRITNAGSGIVGTTLGASGGAETVALTTAQLAAHSHGLNGTVRASGVDNSGSYLTDAGGTYSNLSVNSQGSGAAHQNTPPALVLNYIIKE